MGRATFLSRSRGYLDEVEPFFAKSTWKERKRKLCYLARIVDEFFRSRKLSTEDPASFIDRDVGVLVEWMRESEFEIGYQKKLLTHLDALLAYLGNPTIQRLKSRRLLHVTEDEDAPIETRSESFVNETLARLDALPGWRAEVVHFATACYYHTGLRVKELRLARLRDLDMRAWTFAIAHPKGEGKWARRGKKIGIVPSARHYVLDFLEARARRCRDLDLDPEKIEPLIPNGFGSFYSEAGWRMTRLKTLKEAKIDRFAYKMLRPSFAQRLKDHGAKIEAVSRALRHTSTVTTEKFYARIRNETAWDEVERAWETPLIQVDRDEKS